MRRTALSPRVFALVFLAIFFAGTATLAQGRAIDVDAFKSAGWTGNSAQYPHKTISESDRVLRKLDPFTNIPFYNEEDDIFDTWCRPELLANLPAASTPTLTACTNGLASTYPENFKANEIKIAREERSKRREYKSLPTRKTQIDRLRYARLILTSQKARGTDSNFYLAQANLLAQNWDAAWQQGEIIFKKEPDNDQQIKRMMDLYFATPERYMEYCIWCTRYLRVVKDWQSFEAAYNERAKVEWSFTLEHTDCIDRNVEDVPGFAAKESIAVYFHNTGEGESKTWQEKLFQICANQIDQWVVASGFKLCFQRVDESKDADITFEIRSPQREYTANLNANRAPTGNPVGPPLGRTYDLPDKSDRPRRLIELLIANSPDFYDDMISFLCLHEMGHALGLRQHTPDRGKSYKEEIMHPYFSSPLQALTENDCWRIKDLYKKAPLSLDAINQFALKLNPW